MFQLKTVLTLVATAALAACTTLGPNYQAPAANAPATYRAAAPAAGAGLQRDWWLMFGDAQLNALESQALQASPTLAAAAARIERARAVFGAIQADRLPRVDVGANAGGLRTSAKATTTPVLNGHPVTFEGESFGLSASVGWELDLWGRVKRQTEAAQAQLDASTLDAAAARVALTADVAAAYWQWRALADEAAALQRLRDSRAKAFQVAQTRFDAGSSTTQDLERVRAELAAADAAGAVTREPRDVHGHVRDVLRALEMVLARAALHAEVPALAVAVVDQLLGDDAVVLSRASWRGIASTTACDRGGSSSPLRGHARVLVGEQSDGPDDEGAEDAEDRGFGEVVAEDVVDELREPAGGQEGA